MRTYASAQNIGGRDTQCDAAAVRTGPGGARAYVLLDGIGSSARVRDWTRRTAVRLADRAARRGDAETALRSLYEKIAADPDRQDPYTRRYMPSAAAIVAVTVPGKPLSLAWAGDSRAYLMRRGLALRLTEDHNLRGVYPPSALYPEGGAPNVITSYLGSVSTDEESRAKYRHPAIESTTVPLQDGDRLVLASDGAYEPHEQAGHDLFAELDDDPLTGIVRSFVDVAVDTARAALPEDEHCYVDNATALLATLTP
ncbi:PP2C family protein-serine/threonine phosphatase [Streptomyces sp. NPDC057611]|uniref:PP2C family protein-serine/threonine phosphatase n=1 Tax=Streptomyces sp. NPDC057611 TaxID=3346182 RepID=UPI0036A68F0F